MDTVKVLGSLLSQRAARNGGKGAVLGAVLNGIAQAKEAENARRHNDPRFDHRHHAQLERMVRDGVGRYHQGGGQLYPQGGQWAQQHYPRGGYPNVPGPMPYPGGGRPIGGRPGAAPTVRGVPKPRVDRHDNDDHCSGLGYYQRAELLIRAMVMATQADGKLDAAEQDRIVQQLQPLDQNESEFLRKEFRRRHDLDEFVASVPNGMEYEIYQVSLMAIHLDTRQEADYLRALARQLRIEPQLCNQLHARFGAQPLF